MNIRKCVICSIEKELTKFRRRQKWFSHTCKECYAKQYRTDKPNTGRFKKGHTPTHGFKKGHVPWKKGKVFGIGRTSKFGKYKIWRMAVLNRDGYKCTKCNSEKRLHAHHLIGWRESEELRFEVSNGITLCNSCHNKLHFDSSIGIKTRFKAVV